MKFEKTMRPKWKLKEANWEKFRKNLNFENESDYKFLSVEVHECKIRETIIRAATISIPKTTGSKTFKYTTWWTEEIGNEIKEKKKLFRKFKQSGNVTDLNTYMKKQKDVNSKISKMKKESWEKFIRSSANDNMKEIFDKVKKINGKFNTNRITSIKINNQLITNKTEIVENLALTFSETTKIIKYPQETQQEIIEESQNPFKIPEDIQENYN